MKECFGRTGTVLHIDLSTGETSREHPDPTLYAQYLGGRGLAGRYLRPHATRTWDDPEMPLLVFPGPLAGTGAPGSGRGIIMSRSPLTGTVCDCTVGGRLAGQLRRAGYDGMVVTGRSAAPCGIEIRDNEVRVVGTTLWGTATDAVFHDLEGRMPDGGSVACIGPAAENGSRLASIAVDRHHSAGRGGLGLVCAAKNLKYLAVYGTETLHIHNPAALAEAREEILRLTAASPVLMGRHGFSNWGTLALFDLIDGRKMMPTDNFTRTRFENAARLNAAACRKRFSPRPYGCEDCHIRCKQIAADGRDMPGYEAMAHFTALIGNTDPELAVAAVTLCGCLGLDPISAASALACRREISPCNGTPGSLLDALAEMAEGGELARGAQAYARACGHPEAAMTVKGLELSAFDPRGACGMALGYAVSTRGGCPQRATPISHEILRKPVATDRFSFSGKARIIKIAEDLNAAVDSLAVCKYFFFAAGLEEYAKVLTAVTGLPFSGQHLLEIGERICCNERLMNAENGFTAADDDLPARFFTEPGTSGGGVDIPPLDRAAFLAARANYYTVRGLDENGRPTPKTLARLGLEA